MLHSFPSVFLLFMIKFLPAAAASPDLVFNGFQAGDLILNGSAKIEPTGLLQLTNTISQEVGHAFFPTPFPFLNSSSGDPSSFSTSFVFAIVPHYHDISSEGLAFAITPSIDLSALPSQFLGLFNLTTDGKLTNHIIAVELDTIENEELDDINDNHIGIDVNGLASIEAKPASFISSSSSIQNLSLISGQPMRIWAEYDAKKMEFNVTLAPLNVPKPASPLLSSIVNLSSVFLNEMYVGFSSSTGPAAGSHYILGWSFCINGRETELMVSDLPPLPQIQEVNKKRRMPSWVIWLIVGVLLLGCLTGFLLWLKKMRDFSEKAEDWETEYGPQRFSYRDVRKATKGFSDENLLGNGGFGEVYKGVLSKSKKDIAVKRISHDSKQGLKEFVAEITSIGRLRHRNLVQLLGYTRRRGNLILVYDFMPNGSLDKHLFNRGEQSLSWKQRFKIIKDIAAGLFYLHEGWEQVVLHRDIKASNVLLDGEFNGKLGDFGLARLYEHGSISQTTRVVGTLGYLAPELSRTGKSTTSSDVFAFGAFLLEVACGKRPVELKTTGVELVLVDWVLELMEKGETVEAADRRLGGEFAVEEVEMVLRLGLMCLLPAAAERPSMRQVVQYLDGELSVTVISVEDLCMLHSTSMKNRLVGDMSFSGSGQGTPAGQGILVWDQGEGLPLSLGR